MNGTQVLDRPASESFYAVAGRLLFLQSFDPRLAASLDRLFAGWQLTPVSSPERSPHIKITFRCCERLPEVPSGLDEFAIAEGGRCLLARDGYYLTLANSLLYLREGPTVDVTLWLAGPTDVELARATSFGVCAALRRCGLYDLHSAAVVAPDSEAGVLIIGPSGSGKSTLTWRLATAGWGYLSDDEVLLSLADDRVEARGFRNFFALSSEGEFKSCFAPEDVLSARPIPRAVPGFLLFTAISGENETRLRELSQAETMTRLIRACPWATYDKAIANSYLELLSRLARQTKSFDLLAGTDLLEADQAARIIARVALSGRPATTIQ